MKEVEWRAAKIMYDDGFDGFTSSKLGPSLVFRVDGKGYRFRGEHVGFGI